MNPSSPRILEDPLQNVSDQSIQREEFEMEKEKWKRGGDTNSALSKSKTVIATRENSGMRTKKLKLGVQNVNPRKTKNPRNGGYQDGANQWR